MKRIYFACLTLTISLALSACNLGVAAPNASAPSTAAALTVEAALTAAASSPVIQNTPEASPIPDVAIDGTTAEPATCSETASIARWERDGHTYDKAEADKGLEPNKGFVMSWLLQNTGTCTWNDEYKMVFDSGERLTPTDSVPAMQKGFTVKPGEVLAINVQMTAPAKAGNYDTTFMLVNARNEHVIIMGVITNVGTPSTGKLPAPGDLRYAYDCSGGVTRITLTWKDKADGEEGYRIYREGDKLTDLPAGSTTYDDIVPASGSYLYTVAAFNSTGELPANVTAETSNCQ